MHKKIFVITVGMVFFTFTAALAQTGDIFSFYGLQFGMSKEEIKGVFESFDGNLVRDPGHGMSSIEMLFDREEKLMEIRASYSKPVLKLELVGLQRALREKFAAATREKYPDVSVNIDEYANQTVATVIFQSDGIRESNIEYYKNQYLTKMQ